MEEIFKETLSYGIFAALFVALLFFQLRDSSKREQKYQRVIDVLTKHLSDIKENSLALEIIKEKVDAVSQAVVAGFTKKVSVTQVSRRQ